MMGDDGSGNGLPVRVERAVLAILDRADAVSAHEDEIRRDLRAMFLRLTPAEANALVRRLHAVREDPVVTRFRRVMQ